MHGPAGVATFAIGIVARVVPKESIFRPAEINGQPGFIAYVSGQPFAALIFDIRGGRIHTIYAIGNPDKLQALPAST